MGNTFRINKVDPSRTVVVIISRTNDQSIVLIAWKCQLCRMCLVGQQLWKAITRALHVFIYNFHWKIRFQFPIHASLNMDMGVGACWMLACMVTGQGSAPRYWWHKYSTVLRWNWWAWWRSSVVFLSFSRALSACCFLYGSTWTTLLVLRRRLLRCLNITVATARCTD